MSLPIFASTLRFHFTFTHTPLSPSATVAVQSAVQEACLDSRLDSSEHGHKSLSDQALMECCPTVQTYCAPATPVCSAKLLRQWRAAWRSSFSKRHKDLGLLRHSAKHFTFLRCSSSLEAISEPGGTGVSPVVFSRARRPCHVVKPPLSTAQARSTPLYCTHVHQSGGCQNQ